YLRYSFTKGTDQEVSFLASSVELRPGVRLLDAGCGPGRHARVLAAMGVRVVGVDVSDRFLRIARGDVPDARFVRADIRRLPFAGVFDVAISLCQGGFGLLRGPGGGEEDDLVAMSSLRHALRPGGRLVV